MSILTLVLTSIHLPTLVTILTITYVFRYYFKYFTRPNPLPGPFPIPLFGNVHQMGLDPQFFANKLREKYGDVCETFVGSTRLIWLSRADLAEKIFSPSKKSNYFLRGNKKNNFDDLGVNDHGIVFNRDYASWRFNRKFLSQFTMSTNFLKSFVTEIQIIFKELQSYWSEMSMNENEPVEIDFSDWALRISTDIVIKTTSTQRAYSMAIYFNKISPHKKANVPDSALTESENFIHSITNYIWLIQMCFILPPLVRHYVPGIRQYMNNLFKTQRWFHDRIDDFIRKRRDEIVETPMDQPLKTDILTLLLTYGTTRDITSKNDESSRPLTEEEIRYTMMEVFTGAIDTTANSLSFIIYYLCKYPKVRQKMIEEIEGYTGKDQNAQINFNSLEKLHYCEAVFKEVARINPVVGIMSKVASEEDEIAGYRWPAGQEFFLNLEGMHKNKVHWDIPEEFNPNRFLNERNEIIQRLPIYQFGGGPRACPGRHMALAGLKTLVILLLKRYDFELVDKDAPLKIVASVSNECKDLKIKISPRTVAL
ncbi:13621_t:CDS:1 [Funneliformis caledonium]|uniref:13621_t:CDS:1 n=1 Tax=Funneliformis caledonium TaxID=1117310 RepID=A0A9N9DX95_9GLOM|nr:13621_t:CDS:1 [Funneliformis caledonium]